MLWIVFRGNVLMIADLVPLDFSILIMIEREQKTKCLEYSLF